MPEPVVPESGIWQSFRASWRTMFVIQLIVTAVALAIGGALLGLTVKRAVLATDQATLSDTDLLSILARPGLLTLAFVIAGVTIVLGLLGYSAQVVAARSALRGEAVDLATVLRRTAASFPALIALGLRFLAHVAVIGLPFLAAIATVARLQLSQNDINYYLETRPPEFLLALALAVVLSVIMVVLLVQRTVGWFHALPLVVLRGEPSGAARRLSLRHVKANRRRIFAVLLLWAVAMPLLAAACFLPWPWLAIRAAGLLGEHVSLLALVLALLLALSVLIALIVHFAGLTLLALFHVRLFRRVGLDTADTPKQPPGLENPLAWRSAAAAAAIVVLVGALIGFRSIESFPIKDDAIVIAHRGASALAPENTLAAIILAIELGADWVEVDVQEIASGEIVVFHDRDFVRLAGRPLEIADATLDDLAEIDVGSSFHPRFSDQRVPTLRQVLEVCRGRVGVLIDLNYHGRERQLEKRVVKLIEELGMSEHIRIMSLSQPGLRRVASIGPNWPLGLRATAAADDLTRLDLDFLALDASAIDSRTLGRAHRSGMEAFAWTVNDPLVMSSLLSRGIDGLITDDPALARRLLGERELLNPVERLLVDFSARLGRDKANPSP